MKLMGQIAAAKAKIEQYGGVASHITMGRAFHDAVVDEMTSYAKEPWRGELRTCLGLRVTIDDSAPEGSAWIGQELSMGNCRK